MPSTGDRDFGDIPRAPHEIRFDSFHPDKRINPESLKDLLIAPWGRKISRTGGVDGGSLNATTEHVTLTPRRLALSGIKVFAIQDYNGVTNEVTTQQECSFRFNEAKGTIVIDDGNGQDQEFDPKQFRAAGFFSEFP